MPSTGHVEGKVISAYPLLYLTPMYVFIIKVGDGEIHEHSETAATMSDEAEHACRRRDSPLWRTHDVSDAAGRWKRKIQ